MAYYEYLHIDGCYYDTGIVPDITTRIEIDNVGFVTYSGGWPGIISSEGYVEAGDSSVFISGGAYSFSDQFDCKFSDIFIHTDGGTLEEGVRYDMTLDKDNLTIGEDVYPIGATGFDRAPVMTLIVGARNIESPAQIYHYGDIYCGNVRIYQGGTLVLEWKPTEHNGEYTFYDTVSQTYATKYGSGTVTPGPSTSTFEPSQYDFSFGTNGGTQTFTVTADTPWTAVAPNDFTVSPLSGSAGDTTVTITAPMRLTTKTNTVTFTDSDTNTFYITIAQSDQNITPNLTMYRGSTTIKKMYYGDDLMYRKMAHSPSLAISGDSLTFPPTSYTAATVAVTTDANWRYSTEANWLSLTKTGNNLEIVPASDWDQGSAPRTATITVTADNGFLTKTATITATQKNTNVTNVDWVWVENQGMSTGTYIDTGIIPTTDTSFRVVFQPLQPIGSALVGYSFAGDTQARTPMYSVDDDSDYRVFFYHSNSTMYFDFNSSRISKSVTNSGGFVDLTCTNNSITDNLSGQTTTGTTQSSMATTTVPLYINLSNFAKVRSVEVWQGNTKVYDGHAAYDGDNYGWYDSIGGTFTTQTYGGYTITGE